jgi:hypothetical protein
MDEKEFFRAMPGMRLTGKLPCFKQIGKQGLRGGGDDGALFVLDFDAHPGQVFGPA